MKYIGKLSNTSSPQSAWDSAVMAGVSTCTVMAGVSSRLWRRLKKIVFSPQTSQSSCCTTDPLMTVDHRSPHCLKPFSVVVLFCSKQHFPSALWVHSGRVSFHLLLRLSQTCTTDDLNYLEAGVWICSVSATSMNGPPVVSSLAARTLATTYPWQNSSHTFCTKSPTKICDSAGLMDWKILSHHIFRQATASSLRPPYSLFWYFRFEWVSVFSFFCLFFFFFFFFNVGSGLILGSVGLRQYNNFFALPSL